jgi:hypothetical protein
MAGYAATLGIRACSLGGARPDRFWALIASVLFDTSTQSEKTRSISSNG